MRSCPIQSNHSKKVENLPDRTGTTKRREAEKTREGTEGVSNEWMSGCEMRRLRIGRMGLIIEREGVE